MHHRQRGVMSATTNIFRRQDATGTHESASRIGGPWCTSFPPGASAPLVSRHPHVPQDLQSESLMALLDGLFARYPSADARKSFARFRGAAQFHLSCLPVLRRGALREFRMPVD